MLDFIQRASHAVSRRIDPVIDAPAERAAQRPVVHDPGVQPAHEATPGARHSHHRASPSLAPAADAVAAGHRRPGAEVHEHLMRHPEQRDAVYRHLVRTEPSLIHHLETWQRRDAGIAATAETTAATTRARPFDSGPGSGPGLGSTVGLGDPPSFLRPADLLPGGIPAPNPASVSIPTPPDAAQEAERLLEVGRKAWRGDDFEARQAAYATSLQQGDAAWRQQLLGEILQQDPQALGSWLEPGGIHRAVANRHLSDADRTRIAQTYVAAYNSGTIPSFQHVDTGVVQHALDPVGSNQGDPLADARRVDEFLDFVDAAGSTSDSRAFRLGAARQLNASYASNDRLPVYEASGAVQQTQAATVAALLVSGDAAHPELATAFLAPMDAAARERFLGQVASGSWPLTAAALQPQLDLVMQGDTVAGIAQPDALSALVGAVGRTTGGDADRLAVALARAPGDHESWFSHSADRASAWTDLLARHAEPILDALTDPSFLPVTDGAHVEPAFKDGTHDLGAYLRLINDSGDAAAIDRARGVLTAYGNLQREGIAESTAAEDAIAAGGRLGILAAGVTESINLALLDHADTQAKKQALVGFALDLVVAAVPAGGLAKSAIGDWLKTQVGSSVAQEALNGFSGQVVDSATGGLTDPARAHVLAHLGDGDLDTLVASLRESNGFIAGSLMADLPEPGYEPGEAGRADTIRDVANAYQQALNWITRP